MTDRIALRGLKVRGFHGVLEQERRDGQDFGIDAILEVDISDAAATDDLTRTVDYSEVAQAIAAIVAGEPLDLIETLAERLAAVCLEQSLVSAVEITVHKPHAPIALPFDDVTVTIRRTRER
jgi:7,8-dihydroneopterin aldolase/epimerase/oxygenase